MLTKSYYSAIEFAAALAPTLDKPGAFIAWAEDICEILKFVYQKDYDEVTDDLTEAVKEEQGIEDEDAS